MAPAQHHSNYDFCGSDIFGKSMSNDSSSDLNSPISTPPECAEETDGTVAVLSGDENTIGRALEAAVTKTAAVQNSITEPGISGQGYTASRDTALQEGVSVEGKHKTGWNWDTDDDETEHDPFG